MKQSFLAQKLFSSVPDELLTLRKTPFEKDLFGPSPADLVAAAEIKDQQLAKRKNSQEFLDSWNAHPSQMRKKSSHPPERHQQLSELKQEKAAGTILQLGLLSLCLLFF
ncbi:MAG: hypothetical protein SPG61_07870 [Arcanobacterium sp.]|nr:hypothetical protein [Arcanobacterium sp.]